MPRLILTVLILLLFCQSSALAKPLNSTLGSKQKRDDPTFIGNSGEPTFITVTFPGDPLDPAGQAVNLGDPIEGTSADFFKRAYHDAMIMADHATRWPEEGRDASNMYFGSGVEKTPHKENIMTNIARASKWDNKGGFDNYIILDCLDEWNKCSKKVGKDERVVTCYTINTGGGWWLKSTIYCCPPFFTMSNVEQQHDYWKDKPTSQLDLRYMQTSGNVVIHEMLHTKQITQNRPDVFDQTFCFGCRRIYGPVDVAKAAANPNLSPTFTAYNCDSYAQFVIAMYWQELFNVLPPPQSATSVAPPNFIDGIQDSSSNYEIQVLPPPIPICFGQPSNKPSFKNNYAYQRINEVCHTFTRDAGLTVDSYTHKRSLIGFHAGNTLPESDNDLYISVAKDPVCRPETTYLVDETECAYLLHTVVDQCNPEASAFNRKFGGRVRRHCAIWSVEGKFGHTGEFPPPPY
ncbi:hypothetical protein ONS95_003371 [Cadophora gregata]|uniref:uncharacterized protein n=1 Tax=Cadophora gregata TaxID=51156 RepID=UPI0026DC10BC|nr:uncharacterized protein ONS95_003371 [Cadophora gregata]KAK0108573.1 hypothetical protein ONS95_003371 [Cadophora gregata]